MKTDSEILELIRNDEIVMQFMKLTASRYPSAKFSVVRGDCPTTMNRIHLLCNFDEVNPDLLESLAGEVMPGYSSEGADFGYYHLMVSPVLSFDPKTDLDVTEVIL